MVDVDAIAKELTSALRRGLLDFGWLTSRQRKSLASKGLIEMERIGHRKTHVKATQLGEAVRAKLEARGLEIREKNDD